MRTKEKLSSLCNSLKKRNAGKLKAIDAPLAIIPE
jgi:hypothetical protein